MSSQQISLQPEPRPVTITWIRQRDALWSWEVRHSPVSFSSGVHEFQHIARDALAEALQARGGHGILQMCTLVNEQGGPDWLGTTYAYGRVMARASIAGGRVAWTTPVY